jgi:hypothetical protein
VIHPLSRATTYIETYYIDAATQEHHCRSYATGFFLKAPDSVYLVTNWHVVTGLDPAKPAKIEKPAPTYMKISVLSKSGSYLTELTVPLYDEDMKPIWKEHPSGSEVDVVLYPLDISVEKHYQLLDIRTAVGGNKIDETVAKDVFILGYPFNKLEMKKSFGKETMHFLPVWKRGSIATEPSVRLGGRMLLIDSLSRAGMSGAPVVVAQDEMLTRVTPETAAALEQFEQGKMGPLEALGMLDLKNSPMVREKRFRLLGVYSGAIGNTRLQEIALGKCWHVDTLKELTANSQQGEMPHHAPVRTDAYDALLQEMGKRHIVKKNEKGEVVERVPLD